LKVFKTTVY